MIKIDPSFDAYALKSEHFVLRLTDNTLFAEEKGCFTWIRAHTGMQEDFRLHKIIDTFRKTQTTSYEERVIKQLNGAIARYNKAHTKTAIEPLKQRPPYRAEGAFIEEYVMKFLEPYLAGEIGPENEDKFRGPLIEKLHPQFCSRFPRSTISKDQLHELALTYYLEEYAKSLVRNDIPFIKDLQNEPCYPALKHALAIDFENLPISCKEIQDRLDKALIKVSTVTDDSPALAPLAKKPLPVASPCQQSYPVNIIIHNAIHSAFSLQISLEHTVGELKRQIAGKFHLKPANIALLLEPTINLRETLLTDDIILSSLDPKLLQSPTQKTLRWVMKPSARPI